MSTKKHIDVVAAIVEHEGEYLCMQRGTAKYAYTAFKWEFPGGKIEAGETAEQALVRELHEEMDYDVQPQPLRLTVSHSYPDFDIALTAILCRAATRQFNMKEHVAARWLPKERLPELDWVEADHELIRRFIALA